MVYLDKLIELLQEIAVVNDVLNRTSSVSVEMTLKTYLKVKITVYLFSCLLIYHPGFQIGFQNFYKQTREHIQNESRSYDSNLVFKTFTKS